MWTADGSNLIAPNGVVYEQKDAAAARAIVSEFVSLQQAVMALEGEKASAFLRAKDEATSQALYELEDHAKKLAALQREKRARSQ